METVRYRTVAKAAQAEFIERKSRFIGSIKPVQTEEDAVAFINEIRSQWRDASHHVYAYVLRKDNKMRHSDDGEPQGTGGIPVLEVLTKSGVTDAVVVVTRYFGGILLGAGGLVRAYSHGAATALHEAGIALMARCKEGELLCDYAQYGAVSALLPACGGGIDQVEFGEKVFMKFHFLPEQIPKMERELADATNGQIAAHWNGERFLQIAEE